MDAQVLRLFEPIQIDKSCINFARAQDHPLRIIHVVILPVAQIAVRTGLIQIRRLSNHHLTHFVHKETLTSREESQNGRRLQSLPVDKLLQVELLIKR